MTYTLCLLAGSVLGWIIGACHGIDMADSWKVRAWRRERLVLPRARVNRRRS